MTQAGDPVRWLDSHGSELTAAQREELARCAQREPSAPRRAALLDQIERAAKATGAGAHTSHVEAARAPLAGAVLAALIGAMLLAATLYAVFSSSHAPQRAPAARTSTLSTPAASRPSAPEPSTPAATARPSVSAPARSEVEAPAPSARRGLRAKRSAEERSAAEPANPGAELRLLVPARKLLAVDAQRSLSLVEEHGARFPHGAFVEERDFLRIESLLRLERRTVAIRLAERFRAAYPGSSYLERLRSLLHQP